MESKYQITFSRQSLPYVRYAIYRLALRREPDIDTRTLNWLGATVTNEWTSLPPKSSQASFAFTERHMAIIARAFLATSRDLGDEQERIKHGLLKEPAKSITARYKEMHRDVVKWLRLPYRTPISDETRRQAV